MRTITAAAVANFFIRKALAEGMVITHLKVQKLLYLAYGWHVAAYKRTLWQEPLQAWQYGPVVASVYKMLRSYGNMPITAPISQSEAYACTNERGSVELDTTADAHAVAFLDLIWNTFKKFSAEELTNYSHVPGSPWRDLFVQYAGTIPNHLDLQPEKIQMYFERERERLKFDPAQLLQEHA